jgi:methylmalonyl-CoA/ethylmalonyl-CoA epimerase
MPRELLAGLVTGIDHIGVCVPVMDEAAGLWSELLGLPVAHREGVMIQKTEAAFLDLPDRGATVELVCPMPGNAGLDRFLQKRGAGLHHVAFAVTDIREALRRLSEGGVELIDQAPRKGARGHEVAFLHPRAAGGTLVELVQRAEGHRMSNGR